MGKLAQWWWGFLGALVGPGEPPPRDPSARFGKVEDLKAAGMLVSEPGQTSTEHEIPLGHIPEFDKNFDKILLHHYIRYLGENHLFTVGKPGSGKGARVIIPALLRYRSSCIVIDPKGQNAAVTAQARAKNGHKVLILNPYNVLPDYLGKGKADGVVNCAHYNPLDRINPASDSFVADVRSLAQALIVHQGGESHWPDSARELVAAIVMHVCLTREDGKRNLGEVRALLSLPAEPPDKDGNQRGFLGLIEEMMNSGFAPLAQKAAQFKEGTNEIKSIVSTARTQLAFLDDPAVCGCLSRSDFRFAAFKRVATTVYLVLPFKQLEAQGRWLRLVITSAIEELTEREVQPGDLRVLFLLDEFAQLGRLPAIERALALVRGYGVQLWPFVQDLPQLKSIYPDRWESFLATAGVVQFFPPSDATTAGYLSERLGRRLALRKSSSSTQGRDSSSNSESTSEQWEPVRSPWELYGLLKGLVILFVEGVAPGFGCDVLPYWALSDCRERAAPDPFHLPAPAAVDEAPAAA